MRLFFMPYYAGGILLLVLLALVSIVFKIWMLVDAVRRPESDFNPPNSRVWWIVGLAVGLVLSLPGLIIAIVYYVMIRRPLSHGEAPRQTFGAVAPTRTGRSCSNCGSPLGTHARFCQNCGTPIQEE